MKISIARPCRPVLALSWIALIPYVALAHAPDYPRVAHQWGIEELVFTHTAPVSNPFTDVRLQVTFSCGSRKWVVEGFYDGDKTWKARLMPETQGTWHFESKSNVEDLNAQTGSFVVGAPMTGDHGPIRVANTFHFSYADGTPYFLLGTTLYNWLNRDVALEEKTLLTLSSGPFTKVRFGLFPKWYVYNRVNPTLYPFVQTSHGEFDFDRFDPRFFAHVERRLLDLQRLGIEADIILFHPYDHWGFARMDPAHDEAYIRYVVARLAAFHNVWWTMANEYTLWDEHLPAALLGGPLKPKNWDQLFRVLTSADPYAHERGMHNLGPWYDHNKPWISHVIVQEQHDLARVTRQARDRYRKPTVIDEFGYEGNNGQDWGELSASEEVSRFWDITMAGGYGTHGETYVQPGGLLWWAVGGRLLGQSPSRLAFLKEVMTAAPFQLLEPAPRDVMGGTALALPGHYYLFRFTHLNSGTAVQVRTQGVGPFKVDLIDPWLMQVHTLGYTSAGAQAFSPAFAPSLLRLSQVSGTAPDVPVRSLQQLVAEFTGEDPGSESPIARPFEHEPDYASANLSLRDLLDNPRSRAVIEKHAPQAVRLASQIPFLQVFPPAALAPNRPEKAVWSLLDPTGSFELTAEQLAGIVLELSRIDMSTHDAP